MISYNVNGGAGPFKVVSPPFECIIDSHKLLVMDVIIGIGIFNHPGVERNQSPDGSRHPGFGWIVLPLEHSQRHQFPP